MLEECQRNLTKKLPAALPIFNEILAAINPEVLPNPPLEEYQRWIEIIEAKDAPILAVAVLSKVNCLLTLNSKDFTPEVSTQAGLMIQSPAEFIKDIRGIIERGLEGRGRN